jgi:hypothetical protein
MLNLLHLSLDEKKHWLDMRYSLIEKKDPSLSQRWQDIPAEYAEVYDILFTNVKRLKKRGIEIKDKKYRPFIDILKDM